MELLLLLLVLVAVVVYVMGRRRPRSDVVTEFPPVEYAGPEGLRELYRVGLEEGYRAAWRDIAPLEKDRLRTYVRRAGTVSFLFASIAVVAGVSGWLWIERSAASVPSVVDALDTQHWLAIAAGALAWTTGLLLAWPTWPRRSLADEVGPDGLETLLSRLVSEAGKTPSSVASRLIEATRQRVREVTARLVREHEEKAHEAGHECGHTDGRTVGHAAGYREGFEKGREEGERVGRERGWLEGMAAGREVGREAGAEAGRAEGYAQGRDEGQRSGRTEGYEARLREDSAKIQRAARPATVLTAERLAYARGVEAGFNLGRAPNAAISGLPLLDWWGHHPSLGWLFVDRTHAARSHDPSDRVPLVVLSNRRVVTMARAQWQTSCRSAVDVLTSLEDPAERLRAEEVLFEHLGAREVYAETVRRFEEAS